MGRAGEQTLLRHRTMHTEKDTVIFFPLNHRETKQNKLQNWSSWFKTQLLDKAGGIGLCSLQPLQSCTTKAFHLQGQKRGETLGFRHLLEELLQS